MPVCLHIRGLNAHVLACMCDDCLRVLVRGSHCIFIISRQCVCSLFQWSCHVFLSRICSCLRHSYIYVHEYVYIYMYVHEYVHIHVSCAHTYVWTNMCTYICVHEYAQICVYEYAHIYIYIYVYVYICVCVCVCVHEYVHWLTHTHYSRTHMHTQTHTSQLQQKQGMPRRVDRLFPLGHFGAISRASSLSFRNSGRRGAFLHHGGWCTH